MIIVSGMLGIGKTTLIVKLAEQIQTKFQYIIWRSLQNAPSLEKLLDNLICFFSKKSDGDSIETLDSKILNLLGYLDRNRCLLILDD
jgi:thymidylate kinase